MYNLDDYANLKQLIIDKDYAKSKSLLIKNVNNLYLIKYDKKQINYNNINTLGLFRSVIYDGEKVLSFAPPKSRNINDVLNKNEYNKSWNNFVLKEYVEGTMINVFWDEQLDDWNLATKSNIGAKCFFDLDSKNKKTFRYLFLDAMNKTNLEFENLNKSYSYCFVLQHPENRIVVPFSEKNLYLVVYKFNDNNVKMCNEELERITKDLKYNIKSL